MATTTNGIYYPNDGTKSADILTDLKTMAESIDKNVQKNKYDDTEIKEDISDLQEEQQTQNKNIENLQTNDSKQDSLISKLKSAALNAETEEAKSLHIKDANKFGSLEVLGNHEQETREGYNLLNNILESQTINGLTVVVNKDKSVSINGTATANTNIVFDKRLINTLAAGTYTLKDCQTYIESEENNGWWNAGTAAVTKTFTETPQLSTHGFYLYFSSGTTVNKTYYPALVKGTEEKPYEQYGATPSIKYPSEIKCLGSNKQLFDKDNANKINATPNGLVIGASSSGAKSFYLEVKPNTDYSVSRKIIGQRFVVCTSTQIPATGVSLTQNVANNTGDEINIKTGANDKYLLVYYLYNNSENEEEILSSIKVEEGKKATSYSPYRTR